MLPSLSLTLTLITRWPGAALLCFLLHSVLSVMCMHVRGHFQNSVLASGQDELGTNLASNDVLCPVVVTNEPTAIPTFQPTFLPGSPTAIPTLAPTQTPTDQLGSCLDVVDWHDADGDSYDCALYSQVG